MTLFDWKDSYSCNMDEEDKQHKQLFKLAGDLHELLKMAEKYDCFDDIQKVLQELEDYTIYHFGYEENLMEGKVDEATLVTHKAEHAAFVNKLSQIQKQDLDINQRKVLMDTLMFAVDWIEKHILYTDKKCLQMVLEKGI